MLEPPYVEGLLTIRPQGAPHNGPDSSDNILCLRPNHHALFGLGAISIRR
jgi:putative restriction endonuclease